MKKKKEMKGTKNESTLTLQAIYVGYCKLSLFIFIV